MKKQLKNADETAFARVKTARDAERPYTTDLLSVMFDDFVEMHGDRRYADDSAMVCGIAKLDGLETVVIGHQKGRDLNQRRFRNFGMPKPEGYRKALRMMKTAEKFRRPVITFVDTPGAYPGIDAEERGQAEAIAFNLREMANLKVPLIVVILGEGGSGGALAVGIGDRVLMLENAVYSVITPEGCAAILWKDALEAPDAAQALRLTADDLLKFGLIDEIIAEPSEWKISDESFKLIAENLKISIRTNLSEVLRLSEVERSERRYRKFRNMGEWV